MALDLRKIAEDDLNLTLNIDLISDEALRSAFDKTNDLYFSYRRKVKSGQVITVDISGQYNFSTQGTLEVPQEITLITTFEDTSTPYTQWTYTLPILTIAQGTYTVSYVVNMNPATMTAFPSYLFFEIYIANVLIRLGQRLKFSTMELSPFKLDGNAIFAQGHDQLEDRRHFLMINRDELEHYPIDLTNHSPSF